MTLRRRLLIMIGLSFALLWTLASVWMLVDLRAEFRGALDERLAASARMVASLLHGMPHGERESLSVPPSVFDATGRESVACEISLLRGGVIARTRNSPDKLGFVPGGFATRTIDGQRWRSYTLEQDGVRVTTADRMDRREALLHDVARAAAIPFLIAMVGSLVALWFGVRRGLAPLERVRRALAERRPEALTPLTLPATRLPGELSPLVDTINHLLERTHLAMERERSFTGNAAHELRTPLTAIKTHIQVARRSTDAGLGIALANAEEGVRRLERTLDQLLMLARVEGAFSFGDEELTVARDVAAAAISEIGGAQRARIQLEGGTVAARLAVPGVLAVAALRNLLDNALQYSPPASPVILTLAHTAERVVFRVGNCGTGMREEELRRATQRFWRQGGGQGSGLGLSIVAAIAHRYGGTLDLAAAGDDGIVATLEFPLRSGNSSASNPAPNLAADRDAGASLHDTEG